MKWWQSFVSKKGRECIDPQKLDQKSNFWEVGIFMAKYDFEFKKKVVLAYLKGEGGMMVFSFTHNYLNIFTRHG